MLWDLSRHILSFYHEDDNFPASTTHQRQNRTYFQQWEDLLMVPNLAYQFWDNNNARITTSITDEEYFAGKRYAGKSVSNEAYLISAGCWRRWRALIEWGSQELQSEQKALWAEAPASWRTELGLSSTSHRCSHPYPSPELAGEARTYSRRRKNCWFCGYRRSCVTVARIRCRRVGNGAVGFKP